MADSGSPQNTSDLCTLVVLSRPDKLYEIRDENGKQVDWDTAEGKVLLENCVHNATNYDDVIASLVTDLGDVSSENRERLWKCAVALVLEHYHKEYVAVIEESIKTSFWLKELMSKAQILTKVKTKSAEKIAQALDDWSERLKQVAKLENSQRSLQSWNDTYRVQRDLVKRVLKEDQVAPETLLKVQEIYSARSVNRTLQIGADLFKLEESEILMWVKSSLRYYGKGKENHEDSGNKK